MSEFNKYSTDGGATFIDVEDSKAVHYGDQSKGYVGKNLLRPTINNPTKSDSGVSWSFNADNSIIINGIKTTGSTFINYVEALGSTQYATWDLYLKPGTYKLTGCEAPFEYLRLTDANNTELASDTGNGITFTLTQEYHGCKVLIKLPQNTQVTNKTLYPMLYLASIPDSTYEPWYMSNRELTINSLKSIFSPTQLHNTDDLDSFYGSLDKAGVYQWAGSVPANAPTFGGSSGATYCTLFVFPAGDSSGAWTQICIQGGWRSVTKHIGIRGYGGSPAAWSAWRYVTDATS